METRTYKFRFVSVQWKNKLSSAICVYCTLNIHGRVSAFTHFHSACFLLLALLGFFLGFSSCFVCFSFNLVLPRLSFSATHSCARSSYRNHAPTKKWIQSSSIALVLLPCLCIGTEKFGPIGWNWSNPFSISDFTICIVVLFIYLKSNRNIPGADLRYLCEIWRGHITDDWNGMIDQTYLNESMHTCLTDQRLKYHFISSKISRNGSQSIRVQSHLFYTKKTVTQLIELFEDKKPD